MKWIEVVTIQYWSSEDGDDAGQIEKTHTIKINEDCNDLETECKKILEDKGNFFHRIKSYKFV